MNENNFSASDLSSIILGLHKVSAAGYSFLFNKAGNLKVFKKGSNEHFVLYHNTNATSGYLWRRHGIGCYGYPFCYPLNMKRPKVKHEYTYRNGEKHVYYSDWNGTKPCEFNNIEDALKYFVKYMSNTKRI